MIGAFLQSNWSHCVNNDGFHTPESKKHLPRCPNSEERDPTFQPGRTPPSERKRTRVSRTSISSPCVKAWPKLFAKHEASQTFMERLAKTQLIDGTTMLHKAMKPRIVTRHTISCIIDMINSGADLAAQKGCDRDTPLHMWAMQGGSNFMEIERVKQALQNRICPDSNDLKNINGSTPLHLLCSKGLLNAAKFKVLARWGVSLTVTNHQNQTILHRLAQSGPDINNQKAKILSFLRKVNMSGIINKKDNHGQTALHLAVKEGDRDTFDFLVRHRKIKLNKQDKKGNTALHIAAKNAGKRNKYANHFIKNLLSLGANTKIENNLELQPHDFINCRYKKIKSLLS